MNTGAYTNTTTLTAQADSPSLTAGYAKDTILYENSDVDYIRWGFAPGAVVSLSGETSHIDGATTATIEALSTVEGDAGFGVVYFTTAQNVLSAADLVCNMTKTYTGPHKTQTEANRKRVLGFR